LRRYAGVFAPVGAAVKVYTGFGTTKRAVATPTATPPAPATFASTESVTLATATTGANIYYTVDGSTPTASSTKYTTAISLSATTTIKAIAVKDGLLDSEVFTGTYTKA
jgi:hypothetical protein